MFEYVATLLRCSKTRYMYSTIHQSRYKKYVHDTKRSIKLKCNHKSSDFNFRLMACESDAAKVADATQGTAAFGKKKHRNVYFYGQICNISGRWREAPNKGWERNLNVSTMYSVNNFEKQAELISIDRNIHINDKTHITCNLYNTINQRR